MSNSLVSKLMLSNFESNFRPCVFAGDPRKRPRLPIRHWDEQQCPASFSIRSDSRRNRRKHCCSESGGVPAHFTQLILSPPDRLLVESREAETTIHPRMPESAHQAAPASRCTPSIARRLYAPLRRKGRGRDDGPTRTTRSGPGFRVSGWPA